MYEYDFNIQYVDINSDGVLSDYGLLKTLQEIACLHADSKGYGLKDTPTNRLAWIILSWKVKVFSRPMWNTKIHVKTWVSKMDNISCNRDFEVLDSNGNRLAIASSKWVLLNVDTHHISKISSETQEAFGPIEPSVFNDDFEKSVELEGDDSVFEYTILKRDIDTNRHLNNLNYVLLAKEALPEEKDFSDIEVIYKHQCVLGDKIMLVCEKKDNGYKVAVKNVNTGVIHSLILFK